jgi:hypothetical protein
MLLHVESQPGPHGDREPIAFCLGGKRITVLEIVDRWIAREYSYFKIDTSDGNLYILRFTPADMQWELTLFQSPAITGKSR